MVAKTVEANVTITYVVDGEENKEVSYYVAEGNTGVTNTVADPVKEGYTFKGWYITATPDETDSPFDFGTVAPDATVTVYAVFEEVSTVNDSIDMTQDTSTKGHTLNLKSDNNYFTITSKTNYSYAASNDVLGENVLVAGGGNRDMTITAGNNVQSIKIVLRIGLADSGSFNKAADATVTLPDGTTTTITSSVADNCIYTLEIELKAGQSISIASAKRLAVVGATAEVTPA